jgi:hypothetical protein
LRALSAACGALFHLADSGLVINPPPGLGVSDVGMGDVGDTNGVLAGAAGCVGETIVATGGTTAPPQATRAIAINSIRL